MIVRNQINVAIEKVKLNRGFGREFGLFMVFLIDILINKLEEKKYV